MAAPAAPVRGPEHEGKPEFLNNDDIAVVAITALKREVIDRKARDVALQKERERAAERSANKPPLIRRFISNIWNETLGARERREWRETRAAKKALIDTGNLYAAEVSPTGLASEEATQKMSETSQAVAGRFAAAGNYGDYGQEHLIHEGESYKELAQPSDTGEITGTEKADRDEQAKAIFIRGAVGELIFEHLSRHGGVNAEAFAADEQAMIQRMIEHHVLSPNEGEIFVTNAQTIAEHILAQRRVMDGLAALDDLEKDENATETERAVAKFDIKTATEAELEALNLDKSKVVTGEALAGLAHPERKRSLATRVADKLGSVSWLNEKTAAVAGSVVSFAVYKGWRDAAHLVHVAAVTHGLPIVFGAAAGALKARRETREQLGEITHLRAQGKDISTDQALDMLGVKEKDREKFQEVLFWQTEIRDILWQVNNLVDTDGNFKEPGDATFFEMALNDVAEIQERLTQGDQLGIELFRYDENRNVDEQRRELDLSLAKAKCAISRRITDLLEHDPAQLVQYMSSEDVANLQTQWNADPEMDLAEWMLRPNLGRASKELDAMIAETNAAQRQLVIRKVLQGAKRGAIFGGALSLLGLGAQEGGVTALHALGLDEGQRTLYETVTGANSGATSETALAGYADQLGFAPSAPADTLMPDGQIAGASSDFGGPEHSPVGPGNDHLTSPGGTHAPNPELTPAPAPVETTVSPQQFLENHKDLVVDVTQREWSIGPDQYALGVHDTGDSIVVDMSHMRSTELHDLLNKEPGTLKALITFPGQSDKAFTTDIDPTNGLAVLPKSGTLGLAFQGNPTVELAQDMGGGHMRIFATAISPESPGAIHDVTEQAATTSAVETTTPQATTISEVRPLEAGTVNPETPTVSSASAPAIERPIDAPYPPVIPAPRRGGSRPSSPSLATRFGGVPSPGDGAGTASQPFPDQRADAETTKAAPSRESESRSDSRPLFEQLTDPGISYPHNLLPPEIFDESNNYLRGSDAERLVDIAIIRASQRNPGASLLDVYAQAELRLNEERANVPPQQEFAYEAAAALIARARFREEEEERRRTSTGPAPSEGSPSESTPSTPRPPESPEASSAPAPENDPRIYQASKSVTEPFPYPLEARFDPLSPGAKLATQAVRVWAGRNPKHPDEEPAEYQTRVLEGASTLLTGYSPNRMTPEANNAFLIALSTLMSAQKETAASPETAAAASAGTPPNASPEAGRGPGFDPEVQPLLATIEGGEAPFEELLEKTRNANPGLMGTIAARLANFAITDAGGDRTEPRDAVVERALGLIQQERAAASRSGASTDELRVYDDARSLLRQDLLNILADAERAEAPPPANPAPPSPDQSGGETGSGNTPPTPEQLNQAEAQVNGLRSGALIQWALTNGSFRLYRYAGMSGSDYLFRRYNPETGADIEESEPRVLNRGALIRTIARGYIKFL